MATGQIYMLLGLLSFSLLGVLHKVADVKQAARARSPRCWPARRSLFVLLFVRVRDVRRAGGAGARRARRPSVRRAAASIAILAFQAGVKHGNIATSWLAINLSAGIPTVASILIYDEPVRRQQGAGARADSGLDVPAVEGQEGAGGGASSLRERATPGVVAAADAGRVRRQRHRSVRSEDPDASGAWRRATRPSTSSTGISARCVFALAALLRSGLRPTGREIWLGALMGACSLLGQAFTGLALSHGMPGHVAFPITTGGSLFLVAAAGMVLFKERVGAVRDGRHRARHRRARRAERRVIVTGAAVRGGCQLTQPHPGG